MRRPIVEISMIAIWTKYNIEANGFLTKEQCREIITHAMDEQDQIQFIQDEQSFNLFFAYFDKDHDSLLNKMEIIDLISFLTTPQMINGKYDLLESYNKAKGT